MVGRVCAREQVGSGAMGSLCAKVGIERWAKTEASRAEIRESQPARCRPPVGKFDTIYPDMVAVSLHQRAIEVGPTPTG